MKRVHRAQGGHGHQVVSSATEKRATREIADPPLESLGTRESRTGPSRKGLHIPQSTDVNEHGAGGASGGNGELATFQDLGAAIIPVTCRELGQLTPQVVLTLRILFDELPQLLDPRSELIQLRVQLAVLQGGEMRESHRQDRLGLRLRQLELLLQLIGCRPRVPRAPNDLDHPLDPVQSYQKTLQHVRAILRPLELESGASPDHVEAEIDERSESLFEVHLSGPPRLQREHDDPERRSKLGLLEQRFGHLSRIRVPLELDDEPHAVPVGLVPEIADGVGPALPHHLRDRLDDPRLVHLVWQLRDHEQALTVSALLHVQARPHVHQPSTGLVRLPDPVTTPDVSAGREIRPLHVLQQVRHLAIRIVYQPIRSREKLAEVVGRDLRGHSDRDAVRAVQQQMGEPGGQRRRLLEPAVEVWPPIRSVEIDL